MPPFFFNIVFFGHISWHINTMTAVTPSNGSLTISNLSHKFYLAWLAGLMLTACSQPPESTSTYTDGPASSAGTGRYYMDREIAQVMSYRGADWLERAERPQLERTDLALKNLPLTPSSVVADIGAGSGYFSRRIAQLIPDGKVIAVDIQPEMLTITRNRAAEENISNINTLLAQEKTPNLASNSIDLALLVDVYHELKWPQEVMLNIRDALKPGGQVVLIEYRAEDKSVPIIPIHKMSEAQAQKELEAIGFRLVENLGFLPGQHFLVFAAANKPSSTALNTLAWDCQKTGYVVTSYADNADNLWIFLPGETQLLNTDAAGHGAHYSNEKIKFHYEDQLADLSIDGSKDSCLRNRRASVLEDAKLRGMDFWATGNEPPWSLEIGPEKIRLKTGYESTLMEFPPATPDIDDVHSRVTYSARSDNVLLKIEINGDNCSDSMSGENFESSVKISLNHDNTQENATETIPEVLRGCGKALH
jgi:ubiquinone/menaquinone biosynthesis C-methylase UbiE/uncharacterized membrane protein